MEMNEFGLIKEKEQASKEKMLAIKINKEFESLGIELRWDELDVINEKIEGCEVLKGKKIVMVDDGIDMLKAFIPDLVIATDGNAYFVLHQDQTCGGLVKQILEKNPDIVLVDRNLANRVNGEELVGIILHHFPKTFCIGFSNDNSFEDAFAEAGAKGLVLKRTRSPEKSLKEVAEIFSKK